MNDLHLSQTWWGAKIAQTFQGRIHFDEGFGRHAARLVVSYGWALVLLGIYYGLATWLWKAAYLPLRSYRQPLLAWELIRRPLVLLPAGGLALLFWARGRQRVGVSWQALAYGNKLRIFIGLIGLVCAWAFSTYDYNLYFDQLHLFDRLLLLILGLLVLWKPVFILPFTMLLFTLVAQFDLPLQGQYPWTEMNLVIRILALFAATISLFILTGRQRSKEFLVILLCLIATYYWGSGLGKYHLAWLEHRQLHLLLLGAYSNGWLSFLSAETVVAAEKFLSVFTLPMMVFTLVVEWGAVLILLHRNIAKGLLLGFIAFHLGVFLVSGMFFWKWIVLETALIFLFFNRKDEPGLPIFTPGYFFLSLLLIGAGGTWFRPTNLSWYDTRLTYTFQMEGIAESGQRYPLPVQTFSPYTDMFTLGNFVYLNPESQLTNIWGITQNRQLAQTLVDLHTPAEVEALELKKHRILFEQKRSQEFDGFIQTYLRHLNERGANSSSWSWLRPPAHLWSFARSPVFEGSEPIEKVIVYQVTWFYDDERHFPFRKQVVREILIPAGPTDAAANPE